MSNPDYENSMQDRDATGTYWWTESQIRDEIHHAVSPAELFASRPPTQPVRRAIEKEREAGGVLGSLFRWVRRR